MTRWGRLRGAEMALQHSVDQKRVAATASSGRNGEVYARRYMLFVAPALAVIFAVIVFPWVFTLFMSVHDWQVGKAPSFVGLDNYITLLGDTRFLESVVRTLYYTLLAVGLPVIFGTLAALIFHQ